MKNVIISKKNIYNPIIKFSSMIIIFVFVGVLVACASINEGKQYAEILWRYKLPSPIFSSAALDNDGNIIIGTAGNGVFSISPDGEKELWNFDIHKNNKRTKFTVHTSPSIGDDGTIYFGSTTERALYAVTPQGELKWQFPTAGEVFASPAIAQDGTVYVASKDFKLYALDPDGNMLWFFNTQGEVISSPIIGADNTIFIASLDGFLYVLDGNDGTMKWKFHAKGEIYSTPILSFDSKTVYIGSISGDFYALEVATGRMLWFDEREGAIYSSVALGSDGTIYIPRANNNFIALAPDGTEKWLVRLAGENYSTPVVGDDGTIYVCSTRIDTDTGYFTLLSPDGGLIWQKEFTLGLRSSPTIGNDGTVYFGSGLGYVYAINGKSNSMATHDWAKFRGNVKNQGRASAIETVLDNTEIVENEESESEDTIENNN